MTEDATVAELWRFPVKSMRGERVQEAEIDEAGLRGDRAYAVVDVDTGKVGSAKHPRLWGDLLRCEAGFVEPPTAGAALPPVSIRLPDGIETGSDDPEVDARLSRLLGREVQLTSVAPEGNGYLAVWPDIEGVIPDDIRTQIALDDADERDREDGTLTGLTLALSSPPGTFFDVAALHVLAASTLSRLGELEPESRFAVERYRPNVLVAGEIEPFAENAWTGAGLAIGGVTASVVMPTMRCIMTTLAQGDLPRDNGVLRTIARHNRVDLPGLGTWSCVGAYAVVTASGRVRLGDEVALRAGEAA
jgi:uncharacterized protein YcbX